MTKTASFRVGTPAAQPEVRVIDLRGSEGQLIRKMTQLEADRVVESGLGSKRGEREVRLISAAAHHDGNPRTWLGSQRGGRIRPSKYAHNQRVCGTWPEKDQDFTNLRGGNNS
jgi:hypothetical protein